VRRVGGGQIGAFSDDDFTLQGERELGGVGGSSYRAIVASQSSQSFVAQQYSSQVEMLERLLQMDLEQAIVWQSWDQSKEAEDTSPISVLVGSAGSVAGLFSVGYVLWALRGGAFVAAVATSLPSWRLVDPTALLTAYRASSPTSKDNVDKMLG
jgi:hypothetical protein